MPSVKYEVNVELIQMNFEITETSVFKLQLNEPNQYMMNSKKYRIEVDSDDEVTEGVVDFQSDNFNRVTAFYLNPQTF